MIRYITSLFSIPLIAGCADVGRVLNSAPTVPINAHSYGKKDPEKAGLVYAWAPYSSAAVVDDEGNRCVLAAGGAKTVQADSEADVSLKAEILKSTEMGAKTKESLLESFTKLKDADTDAAFADIALFHLCILDQNGTFKDWDKGNNEKGSSILSAYLETIKIARAHKAEKSEQGGQ